MTIVNAVALVLGIIALLTFGSIPGIVYPIILGMMLLLVFSLAANVTGFDRLYVYGLLAGLAPPVGEWLWAQGYASHHGFPLTFGITAGVMIAVGLVTFVRLIRTNPLPRAGNGR
jgi:hypothetical protein